MATPHRCTCSNDFTPTNKNHFPIAEEHDSVVAGTGSEHRTPRKSEIQIAKSVRHSHIVNASSSPFCPSWRKDQDRENQKENQEKATFASVVLLLQFVDCADCTIVRVPGTMAPALSNSHIVNHPVSSRESSSRERARHYQDLKNPHQSPNAKELHPSLSKASFRRAQPLQRSGSFPQHPRSSSLDRNTRRKRSEGGKKKNGRLLPEDSFTRENDENSTFLALGQYGLGNSDASSSQDQTSSFSEDLSSYSAQSAPIMPHRLTIEYSAAERRDPSPISLASHSQKRDFPRDSSPDSSQESEKHYMRTTRKIIEGM